MRDSGPPAVACRESAVYIRMDVGPAHQGLSVACQAQPVGQVRYFGPYLGGLLLRRAIAALHRILPLCHADDRLGGAERDLARMRGAAGGDRTALADLLTAILERQPVAVSWAHPPAGAVVTARPRPWPRSWPPGSMPRSAR